MTASPRATERTLKDVAEFHSKIGLQYDPDNQTSQAAKGAAEAMRWRHKDWAKACREAAVELKETKAHNAMLINDQSTEAKLVITCLGHMTEGQWHALAFKIMETMGIPQLSIRVLPDSEKNGAQFKKEERWTDTQPTD